MFMATKFAMSFPSRSVTAKYFWCSFMQVMRTGSGRRRNFSSKDPHTAEGNSVRNVFSSRSSLSSRRYPEYALTASWAPSTRVSFLVITSQMQKASFRRPLYSSKDADSSIMGPLDMNLCPYVILSEKSPAASKGTTSLPIRETIHLMGLANLNLPVPHLMALGKGMSARSLGRRTASISMAGFPSSVFLMQRYAPFLVSSTFSWSTATLFLLANPRAALAGVPSGLNAILAGGPIILISLSGCFSARSWT